MNSNIVGSWHNVGIIIIMKEVIKNRRNHFGSLLLFWKMLSIKRTKEDKNKFIIYHQKISRIIREYISFTFKSKSVHLIYFIWMYTMFTLSTRNYVPGLGMNRISSTYWSVSMRIKWVLISDLRYFGNDGKCKEHKTEIQKHTNSPENNVFY